MVLGHLKQEHTNHKACQAAFLICTNIYKPHFHTGMQLASATQVEAEPFPGLSSAFCLFVCFSRRSKTNPAEPTWPFNLNKNEMKVHVSD